MPFLLAGSSNDVESGDLKIKPGTSNVLDPMIKYFIIDDVYEEQISSGLGMGYKVKTSKRFLEDLKHCILNNFRPILVIHDGDIASEEYISLFTKGTDFYGLLSPNKHVAYFGNMDFVVMGMGADVCIFDMDEMELLYFSLGLGLMPNTMESSIDVEIPKRIVERKNAINKLRTQMNLTELE